MNERKYTDDKILDILRREKLKAIINKNRTTEFYRDELINNGIFNEIINDKTVFIESELSTNEKIQVLDNLIEYYIRTEEYEKCVLINKIKDSLN